MFKQFPVSIVVGISKGKRAIGLRNELLWHVPDDLKRFKTLTLGKPVIMGRKTFESIVAILGKPLPGRTNIVLTRNADYFFPGAMTATSLLEAFEIAALENPTEIHIGGGAELYAQALPFVDRLYLTLFDEEKEADAFFPEYETEFTETKRYSIMTHGTTNYEWVDYVRKS